MRLLFLLLLALPAAAQTPIVSSVPWSSYTQSVQPGDAFTYTFTGTAGQVASVDLLALSDITQPGTQTVIGTMRITDDAGMTLRDDAYGSQILTWQANNTTVDGTVRSIQVRDVGLTVVLPEDGSYRVEVEVISSSADGSYELRFNLLDPGAAFTVSDGTSNPTCVADTGFLRSAMRAVQAEGTVTACAGTHLVQRELYATVPGLTLQGESGTVVALGTPGSRRGGSLGSTFDELRFTDERFTLQRPRAARQRPGLPQPRQPALCQHLRRPHHPERRLPARPFRAHPGRALLLHRHAAQRGRTAARQHLSGAERHDGRLSQRRRCGGARQRLLSGHHLLAALLRRLRARAHSRRRRRRGRRQ